MKSTFRNKLDLNLFGDGDGADTSTGVQIPGGTTQNNQVSGEKAEPTQQSQVTEPEKSPEELKAEYQELVKGKYKSFFDEDVKGLMKNRFKKYDGIEKENKEMQKTLSLIGQRYGTDKAAELYEAISKDTSLFADQALEAGMSEEAYLNSKRMEFENEQLKGELARRDEEEKNRDMFIAWHKKELELQKDYPNFSLQEELKNPDFGKLLVSGVDMKTVYEVVHHADVTRAVAQQTAAAVQEKQALINTINQKRPSESGLSSQGGIATQIDVSKLTRDERRKLAMRAKRGENIPFS